MFKAPDGTAIEGEIQEAGGVWRVTFTDPQDAEELVYADDGPSTDWSTVLIDGEPAFYDVADQTWLAHHLIPDDDEPLSNAAWGAARNEIEHRKRADLYGQIAATYEADATGRKEALRQRDIELAAARAMYRQFVEAKGDA